MKGCHFRNMDVETSLELAKPLACKCFNYKADYETCSILL